MSFLKISIMIYIFVTSYLISYRDVIAGPFGVEMGDRIEQFNNLNPQRSKSLYGFDRYTVDSLPKTHSYFIDYTLWFNSKGLVEVSGNSAAIYDKNESYEMFDKLFDQICNKYSDNYKSEYANEYDIKNQKLGEYVTLKFIIWPVKNINNENISQIELQLRRYKLSSSYNYVINLSYIFNDYWHDIPKDKDKDAL